MKKLLSILVLLIAFTFQSNAQAAKDYFPGKWSVVIEGTPDGDAKMTLNLERKEGKLSGTLSTEKSTEPIKISKIDEEEKSITVYFTVESYDVNMLLEKKDDDNVTGNVMGMFEVKGQRVKEEPKTIK